MKKLFFIAIVALFGFSANAQQDFTVGASMGFPLGDANNAYSFTTSFDANYIFASTEFESSGLLLKYGVTTGYTTFYGKSILNVKNASFAPIAGLVKLHLNEDIYMELDLGYGVGLSSGGNNGGVFYRFISGRDNLFGRFGFVASFASFKISNINMNTLSLGLNYRF
jgi:hypothetical protein